MMARAATGSETHGQSGSSSRDNCSLGSPKAVWDLGCSIAIDGAWFGLTYVLVTAAGGAERPARGMMDRHRLVIRASGEARSVDPDVTAFFDYSRPGPFLMMNSEHVLKPSFLALYLSLRQHPLFSLP